MQLYKLHNIVRYFCISAENMIAEYQFIKSCTWWQVYEIWYGDRYEYEVSKNHRKQVEMFPWWSDWEQSNMAATEAWKSHISAKFMTRIKCYTTFFHVFRYEESIFGVIFELISIFC